MPIYEYKCSVCDNVIEKMQKVDDPAPKCHGTMTKIMSKGSFILKGDGWYATDYGRYAKKDKPKKPEK